MKQIAAVAIATFMATGHSLAAARSSGGGTGSNPSSHSVRSYTTSKGTYVPAHRQTAPNGTTRDNYGTKPNLNPYNGKTGTRGN